MIEIKNISAQEAYSIRKDILRENIALTEKMDGDFAPETIHLGVFKNNELACVATFMQHNSEHFEGSQYRLRGMATHRNIQHQGLGKLIIEEAIKIFLKMDIDILWCNARVFALDFYNKCGFKVVGEAFDVHLIGPHYVMFKELKK